MSNIQVVKSGVVAVIQTDNVVGGLSFDFSVFFFVELG